MRIYIYLVALVLQVAMARAQVFEHIVIPAGDSIKNHYSFLFTSYEAANVKFRDGHFYTYKMNFNTLICQMEYINAKGDTLQITNPELIDSILMDSCSFIYDYKRGYFQILAQSGGASLAINRLASFQPVQKGSMGESQQDAAVTMLTQFNNRTGTLPLVETVDVNAARRTTYVLILKSGDFEDVGKSTFMKIYSGDKKTFEQYVKANKIDYNRQGDLEKLFNFCTQAKN